ncbi:VWA domain-containing protein [Glaciimonas sp. PCH181]|uniref:vWA domain-containing protein n=1 Tax=Glaciimonas sp. PCH181 TaxID=2133943 RepID=UPI000D3D93A1|nr:VWA domain-containing protein [Glaciimonas sp. PCH181]PUA19698.1 hypothetical protein C7W93_07655 [Glaciimonas sp. PCH181]
MMVTTSDNLRITTDFTLRLCALLRQSGVDVGTQQSIACMDALLLLGTVSEDDLKAIYRITLINRKQDLYELHKIYELLMKDYLSPRATPFEGLQEREAEPEPIVIRRREYSDEDSSLAVGEDLGRVEGYSVREVDYYKDFQFVPKEDMPSVMAEIEKVAKKFASIKRRKTKRSKHHGAIDLRASVRDSVKFDGEILNWRYKRKVPTHSRWVILSDVSGSMEIYSIFLLNFLHFLNENHRMKMETFVFSTRVECLTEHFRSKDFREMLKNVAQHFSGWSGGTKIGAAIKAMNETYAGVITPKTTVIIMSDGWDTGDIDLLDKEMSTLRSRAKSIIWINPLKASPLYEPLALGMATARPYCDQFITGHSINSLEKLTNLLAK